VCVRVPLNFSEDDHIRNIHFLTLRTHIEVSACFGNGAGNHFPKFLPVLSDHIAPNVFQVIQNETLSG
jgi:hypothetical protein